VPDQPEADQPAALGGGLRVESLGLRFDNGSWALEDLTLDIGPGEVLTVVGPSGAGKSSLLRLVCGLAEPTTGRIVLDGADLAGVAAHRRPVAMVFQGFALFPHLTAGENIAFGLKVRRESDIANRVASVAETLGIGSLLDRRPLQLSGGERQRVALARALVRSPRVFCLDEPLSSLDPVLRADARLLLADVLRADGRCGLVVTHDQAEALTMGDRVAVLKDGRLEQVGTPREVYAKPATAFVASFIGNPPMALLRPPVPGVAFTDGLVGVRAENVVVGEGDHATVTAIEDLGHEVHLFLDLDGQRLVSRAPTTSYGPGDRVGVRVESSAVHHFPGIAPNP
jgi:multiple sugar transport system ATP-binding protein